MKIKLTESKLKQIVAESVKNVLNESEEGYWGQLLNEIESMEEMLSPIFENNEEVSEEEMFNLLRGCYSASNRIKNLAHEGRRYYSQL